MTHEQVRARLRAMQVEINDALSNVADGRYDLALENVAALADCGLTELAGGLAQLEADNPQCGCADQCELCAPWAVAS
jgi:hypothetical protein